MLDNKLNEKLKTANTLKEVEEIVKDYPDLDANKIWQEIENHKSIKSEKLDLNELDNVAGGADRDWQKDGCAATCESNSWCASNDYCVIWAVTGYEYDYFRRSRWYFWWSKTTFNDCSSGCPKTKDSYF